MFRWDEQKASICRNDWLWRLILDFVFCYFKVFSTHYYMHDWWSSKAIFWQKKWLVLHDWTKAQNMFTWSFVFSENYFRLPFSSLSTFEAVCLALYYILSLRIKKSFRSWVFSSMGMFRDKHFLQKSTNLFTIGWNLEQFEQNLK